MFATTVQAELNATFHVCENGLQDVLTNRSNFTSNVVFQFLYGAWLVGISFPFKAPHRKKSGGLKSRDLCGHKAFEIIRSSKKVSIGHALIRGVACGSILLKIAISELVFVVFAKEIHEPFANKSRTVQELENNIRREIAALVRTSCRPLSQT